MKRIMLILTVVMVLVLGLFQTSVYAKEESNAVPFLTLISPDGDEGWARGTVHPIFWQSEGIEKVVIQLYKGNESVFSLTETPIEIQQNLDYFVWEIPKDLKPGNDYRVKVYSVSDNETLELVDFSRGPFRIDDYIPQRIVSISPFAKTQWAKGETQTIVWEYDGNVKEVYLELHGVNNGALKMLTGPIKNKGYFVWEVPADLKSGEYYVLIKSVDDHFACAISYFRIDSCNKIPVLEINPNIYVLGPVGGETIVGGTVCDIFWESVRTKRVSVSLYRGDEYICSVSGPIESSGHFSWLVPGGLEPADNYRIRIFDWDTGWYPAYSGFFTVVQK